MRLRAKSARTGRHHQIGVDVGTHLPRIQPPGVLTFAARSSCGFRSRSAVSWPPRASASQRWTISLPPEIVADARRDDRKPPVEPCWLRASLLATRFCDFANLDRDDVRRRSGRHWVRWKRLGRRGCIAHQVISVTSKAAAKASISAVKKTIARVARRAAYSRITWLCL